MKTSSIILASALTLGAFSSQVNAQESALENLLTVLVKQAVTMTTSELESSARELVANTSHVFELETPAVKTRVSVTDIAAKPSKKENQDAGE